MGSLLYLKGEKKNMAPRSTYLCDRCKYDGDLNIYCLECSRGSRFVEASYKVGRTPYFEYAKRDAELTTDVRIRMLGNMMSIKKVVFNDPVTVVLWADGTKTIVRCQEGDVYDCEKGLAMAIAKKALGNKGSYCEIFKKWLPEEEEKIEANALSEFTFEGTINHECFLDLTKCFGGTITFDVKEADE